MGKMERVVWTVLIVITALFMLVQAGRGAAGALGEEPMKLQRTSAILAVRAMALWAAGPASAERLAGTGAHGRRACGAPCRR